MVIVLLVCSPHPTEHGGRVSQIQYGFQIYMLFAQVQEPDFVAPTPSLVAPPMPTPLAVDTTKSDTSQSSESSLK